MFFFDRVRARVLAIYMPRKDRRHGTFMRVNAGDRTLFLVLAVLIGIASFERISAFSTNRRSCRITQTSSLAMATNKPTSEYDENGDSSNDWDSDTTPISTQLSDDRIAKPKVDGFAPQERDLFIPIFALVSIAGLMGAYGYEMVRLYLRGELYLPFTL
jgi:hypothetical protein